MARVRSSTAWAGVMLMLVAAIAGIYTLTHYLEKAGPDFAGNELLLPILSTAVVVLLLGLAGVLVRNLVRLVMHRKRGILGSGLRIKLVFFFLALVLPPAVVLFYGSATIIKMTVDAMLRTPVDSITRESRQVVNDWVDFVHGQCVSQAERLSQRLSRGESSPPTADLLDRWRRDEQAQLAALGWGDGPLTVARGAELELPAEVELRLLGEAVAEAVRTGEAARRQGYLVGRLAIVSAVPLPAPDRGEPPGAVAVAALLPRETTGNLQRILLANENFNRFRYQRRELIALYLSVIALIFLVSVFGATWMGFYLSRRITGPVQQLAAASREISTGNLAVRVDSDVGDELGTLVRAFNEMAGQLQESQEVITRSTAQLRRSNLALDERRRYIETLLANLSTGVTSLDPAGHVTTVNPAVQQILGVTLRPGDDARLTLEAEGLESLAALLGDERNPRDSMTRDLTLQRGGRSITVAVQVSSLKGRDGERLGTLVMVEDLTELLRAQRAAAWREVARRIAHEIKNPLTPIQLAAQRVRKKFEQDSADLAEVVQEGTASIEREVGALKALVDEFSRFARMPEIAPQPVKIEEVIDEVLALYSGLPGINWIVETDPAVGIVRLDPQQMRRVLINLIDNAVEAMDGSGTIQIRTRSYAGPGSLRIELADSGPGIPPGDRDRMFVPYFSTKGRGTGLGLAIVHRVVTDHHGAIRVESNPPQGARFVIEIPS